MRSEEPSVQGVVKPHEEAREKPQCGDVQSVDLYVKGLDEISCFVLEGSTRTHVQAARTGVSVRLEPPWSLSLGGGIAEARVHSGPVPFLNLAETRCNVMRCPFHYFTQDVLCFRFSTNSLELNILAAGSRPTNAVASPAILDSIG